MAVNVSFTADVSGAKNKLRQIATFMDRRKILTAIGLRALKWINDNFKAQGTEKPWKPLAPSTIYAKGSSRILADRGRLRQSFGIQSMNVTEQEVTIGTNVFYAKFHEEGTSPYVIRPKGNYPLRFAHPDGTVLMKAKRGGKKWHILTREVHHPGLPIRKIAPSKAAGARLVKETTDVLVAQVQRQANAQNARL